MHKAVQIRVEQKRGCGWRKVGGVYLMSDGPLVGCGKFPAPLPVCECCGFAVKLSRAPKWLKQPIIKFMFDSVPCDKGSCSTCAVGNYSMGAALLISVGEVHYRSTYEFVQEVRSQGFSRRITHVPRDFVVGKTYVLLAHKKAIAEWDGNKGEVVESPGVFAMICPQRIEVVVDENTPDDTIDDYIKRGLTPVIIQRHVEPEPAQAELMTIPGGEA